MFKKLNILLTSVMVTSAMSCGKHETIDYKPVPPKTTLEVTVTGSLSGKPRDGISVVLYESSSDADNQTKPLTSAQSTDSNGKTTFSDLEEGKVYVVRVDALLSKNIKSTDKLKSGTNYFNISLL